MFGDMRLLATEAHVQEILVRVLLKKKIREKDKRPGPTFYTVSSSVSEATHLSDNLSPPKLIMVTAYLDCLCTLREKWGQCVVAVVVVVVRGDAAVVGIVGDIRANVAVADTIFSSACWIRFVKVLVVSKALLLLSLEVLVL